MFKGTFPNEFEVDVSNSESDSDTELKAEKPDFNKFIPTRDTTENSTGSEEGETSKTVIAPSFIQKKKPRFFSSAKIHELKISKDIVKQEVSKAIKKGDINFADKLNTELISIEENIALNQDYLAQNLSCKSKSKTKKKVLKWGFTVKKRWETKSNM